jgi:glycosyltransferase involved in cell wall biosynthesis
MDTDNTTDIVVVIPCFNEELTIGKVISDFRRQLPQARIVVIDNNCTDRTAAIAVERGATVLPEPRQGKGYAVETIFHAIRADLYVMVDGDDTYDAESVHRLIEPVLQRRADMAVATRLAQYTQTSFRNLHVFGNRLVRFFINRIMGSDLQDILSGYRAFNATIAETIPVVSSGFEIETEITLQSLYYHRKIVEIALPYRGRPQGSASKLSTFRDGFRVLWKLFSLFRSLKPLTFFGGAGLVFAAIGILCGLVPIHDYLTHPNHIVTHVPLAILAASLMILAFQLFVLGLLLHAINWRFRELHNVLTRPNRRR